MELELKHLAGYLPYGLKARIQVFGDNETIVGIEGLNQFEVELSGIRKTVTEFWDYENIKPILRPLSDLTKEIEVNGEKFVPIEMLFEIDNPEHISKGRGYYYTENPRFINCSGNWCSASTSINILELDKNNYWKIQQLLEWHFDIYGLIENNLAIDMNTLNNDN